MEASGSRIPVSKSQDDLLRTVPLRRESKDSKLRPSSYFCSSVTNGSPRNSKLMSRNSVEVLTYTESQKNKTLNDSGARKYYGQNQTGSQTRGNNKHEAAAKLAKKSAPRDPSLNQKSSKLQRNAAQKSVSLIPQPAAAQNLNKKSSVQSTAGKKQTSTPSTSSSSGGKQLSGQLKAGSGNNFSPNSISSNKEKYAGTKRLSNDSLKSDDRIRVNNAKNTANTSRLGSKDSRVTPSTQMINERKPERAITPSSPSRKLAAKSRTESAQRVLSDQLLRGKVPPKAKFRADDEISIGEAGETSEGAEEVPDLYPPSRACLVVARCLEEGGRSREMKTNSLPLNSGLCSESCDSSAKTTSLRDHYRPGKQTVGKSTSEGFFQRLTNLRRSFNSHDNKRLGNKIRPHLTDSNSPFFQGITDRKTSSRSSKVHHSHSLVILPIIKSYKPPVRKYLFQRSFPVGKHRDGMKRSFSFSDAQIIAQSVEDGEGKVISDLYPAFLISHSVYSLSERTKFVKSDKNSRVSNTSIIFNKCSQVGKDSNSSEQTENVARPVKGDDDNQEDRTESPASQVTLTSSVVKIRTVAGKS